MGSGGGSPSIGQPARADNSLANANSSPASLARLAVDTGGRYTERTSDLSLGFARAQRDLACVYSIGFYDDNPLEDTVKNVSIKVKQRGLQAVHASKYIFRSREAKLESRLRAAFLSPELYQTGVVRAHVFPLRPNTKKQWEGLLAVSFPVPLAETGGAAATREFSAMLHTGSEFIHGFDRRITLEPGGPDVTTEPRITFLEPVDLQPGNYVLTVVMSDPDGENPHTARVDVEVPEIPKKQLFIAGPMLGKAAGINVVIRGTGGESHPTDDDVGAADSFEPLLVQQLDEPVDLVALTEACVVGDPDKSKGLDAYVDRRLRDSGGEVVGTLPVQELPLTGYEDTSVHCENLLDLVPASRLKAGEYSFEASLRTESGQGEGSQRVRFSVGSATSMPKPPPTN
ncbi:MAG: hypothetical protein R3344_00705 [Acidobacteriota bacterium]|nr:hypothetical protein [Acidobacteriota bacterium]